MRRTFKILLYINKTKVKIDGTTAIMCRITIDGKNAVMTTGLYCKPEDWNSKKGEVREDRMNRQLREYKQDILLTSSLRHPKFSSSQIRV